MHQTTKNLLEITTGILLLFISVSSYQGNTDLLYEVKKHAADLGRLESAKAQEWERLTDSLKCIANINATKAIADIELILQQRQLLTSNHLSDLYFMKGDIQYKTGHFSEAIDEFTMAGSLVARGCAYIKKPTIG